MPSSCVLCAIRADSSQSAVVYEDEQALVLLDIFPLTRGHLLVLSKQHAPVLAQLPQTTQAHLLQLINRAIAAQQAVLPDCSAANVLLNDGRAAGQHIPHVHWHVIPRRGGVFKSLFWAYLMRPLSIVKTLLRRTARMVELQQLARELQKHF